jgi:hypothetical protein
MKLFAHFVIALFGAGLVGADTASSCPCSSPGPAIERAALPACCFPVAAPADPQDAPKPADKAKEEEATIKANLAKLSDADRKLAEAQRFCAVENDDRLGSMGVPFKILIKDQPVFLCCKGCAKQANADPDKTLAKVKELKAKYGEKK